MSGVGSQRLITDSTDDIINDWKNIYFGAKPYLQAMRQLQTIEDMYGCDNAKSIIGNSTLVNLQYVPIKCNLSSQYGIYLSLNSSYLPSSYISSNFFTDKKIVGKNL